MAQVLGFMSPSLVARPTDQNVLVVVDDPAVRASLQFALEIEGFLVDAFETGDDLLAHGRLPTRACLVVDYYLPRMNGIDVVVALRERGVDFPTILMTTDPPGHLRRQAFDAKLTLVEKPLLGNDLAEAIREALSRLSP